MTVELLSCCYHWYPLSISLFACVCRFGQPPAYSTLKLCDEQTASMVCPFKSGETVYVECTQRSPVDKTDHVPFMGVSKLEDKEKLLKRGGEIYNTITEHAAVENFQVYKVDRVFDNSRTHLYAYISYTDSFVKVPEVVLMCPPGERLPLSVLQPTGLVYLIIKKHVSLQHLNAYLLPLFPGRAFIYSAEEDRLCEVEETQVLNQDVQKICFCGITIFILSAWPSHNWSSLPPCSYCTGVCDDPR